MTTLLGSDHACMRCNAAMTTATDGLCPSCHDYEQGVCKSCGEFMAEQLTFPSSQSVLVCSTCGFSSDLEDLEQQIREAQGA